MDLILKKKFPTHLLIKTTENKPEIKHIYLQGLKGKKKNPYLFMVYCSFSVIQTKEK